MTVPALFRLTRRNGQDDEAIEATKHDGIGALLEFAVEMEQSPEEAEEELREMGVDVNGFLARVRKRREARKDEA